MTNVNFQQNVDLWGKQLLRALAQVVSGDPSSPLPGQFWYDSSSGKFKYRNETINVDPTDRARHTGQQTASTISDIDTWLGTHQVTDLAAPDTDLSMASHKITNLLAGNASGDAINYQQLQDAIASIASGTAFKDLPVRAATTGNITLSGTQTIDGVSLVAGNRVLVKDQADPIQNGIYVVAAGGWTRATDADAAGDLRGGTLVTVDEGTANADSIFILTTNGSITPGTDANAWTLYNKGSGGFTVAGLGLTGDGSSTVDVGAGNGISVAANAVSIDRTSTKKVMQYVSGTVPTGVTDATINHGLGFQWVDAVVYDTSLKQRVYCGLYADDANNCTLSFADATTAGQYTYTIYG